MKNPLSHTRFKFTKDRIQHYCMDLYECEICHYTYHPKVHSQPYIIQFGAILIGLTIGILLLIKANVYFHLIDLVILIYFIFYYRKERKTVSSKNKKIKYGDIILQCPQCGSEKASKV